MWVSPSLSVSICSTSILREQGRFVINHLVRKSVDGCIAAALPSADNCLLVRGQLIRWSGYAAVGDTR
jgi:hypothetical protein